MKKVVREFGEYRLEYRDTGFERSVVIARREGGAVSALEVRTNGTACLELIFANGPVRELCTNATTARGMLWWLLGESRHIDSVEKLKEFIDDLESALHQAVDEIAHATALNLIREDGEQQPTHLEPQS